MTNGRILCICLIAAAVLDEMRQELDLLLRDWYWLAARLRPPIRTIFPPQTSNIAKSPILPSRNSWAGDRHVQNLFGARRLNSA